MELVFEQGLIDGVQQPACLPARVLAARLVGLLTGLQQVCSDPRACSTLRQAVRLQCTSGDAYVYPSVTFRSCAVAVPCVRQECAGRYAGCISCV